jgi:hypothetical protein
LSPALPNFCGRFVGTCVELSEASRSPCNSVSSWTLLPSGKLDARWNDPLPNPNRTERVKRGGGATSRLRSWRPRASANVIGRRQNSTSDNVSFLSVPRVAGRLEGSLERFNGWINCACFEMSLERAPLHWYAKAVKVYRRSQILPSLLRTPLAPCTIPQQICICISRLIIHHHSATPSHVHRHRATSSC